ncbi:CubicO group peptidase (beta-lactamase class C family) [Stackebrandtia albiflava]|uniref:CubicO group peptidase (Beta-lactamase class C family) n=1 Tax=Stackebrandtia albiflava TaxID=406432 RepID=A0A562UQS3_9ACTN|nr:serine hydrolase domain-containing protein [Stackebrandtia albiflava]TWJ07973.1 CubicO group peptidase (beta-lactamase class C family) [Stackebrandtia albiflava]
MRRRAVLTGMAALSAAPLLSGTGHAEETAGTPTGPPTVTPQDIRFPRRPPVLRPGTAAEAGLTPEHLAELIPELTGHMHTSPPSFPGAVVLVARHGVVAETAAIGHAVRYASWDDENDVPVALPADQWVPMTTDTIFDMASVTKLFTSVLATQLVWEGSLDPDAPVTRYLPEFASLDPDKAAVTVDQLYRHVSGQIAFINMYSLPDDEARMRAIYARPLQREPGSGYEYSDLNLIVLAEVMCRITGDTLDGMVAARITGPLGMTDTGFNPPEDRWHRVAATEYQPWTGRGMIRGSVHDENAWSFGGVAGHAGIFSTAADLAVFGQTVLNGGEYDGVRILPQDAVRAMITNTNAEFGPSAARGIGWQIDQRFYMDALTSPVTAGHTGYTGTSITVDPLSGTLLVLLTNRVHPTREWGTVSTYRRGPARVVARSVPVEPRHGRRAWFGGQRDGFTATLTAPMRRALDDGSAEFSLWYDTESTDHARLLASPDGTTWTAVDLTVETDDHRWSTTDGALAGFQGRQWCRAHGDLPAGTTVLRWSYESDPAYQGRGVYITDVRVRDGHRLVFDSRRPRDDDAFVAVGWTRARD